MMPNSRPSVSTSLRAFTPPAASMWIFASLGFVACVAFQPLPGMQVATAQDVIDQTPNSTEATPPGKTKESNDADLPTVTPAQQQKIESLIEQLSARKFAQRENAATELLKIGVPALASLRKELEFANDEESRIRITELIEKLIDGQTEVQIQDFMAMKDVKFKGWPEIRNILGEDTIATRGLFVEILRKYPKLPAAMQRTQTTRDRNIALESVVAAVEETQSTQTPTTADAFALLIPLLDSDVAMPAACENIVISILQLNTGTKIRKDNRLSPIFKYLLGEWMAQTSLANREDVLFYGMDWDLNMACRLLSERTIATEKNASVEVIAICLQALARFGNRNDVATISTLLDDQRPVSKPSVTTQGTITHQVSDLAIAATACIHGVDLEDVGFTGVERHPKFGFLAEEIGFPKDQPEKRVAAQKMIKAILEARPSTAPRLFEPPVEPPLEQ